MSAPTRSAMMEALRVRMRAYPTDYAPSDDDLRMVIAAVLDNLPREVVADAIRENLVHVKLSRGTARRLTRQIVVDLRREVLGHD